MKNAFYLALLLLIQVATKAQMKIGDNPTTLNSASLLELETTNKGLVFPRVSLTNVSSPAPLPVGLLIGTVVFNTNTSVTGGNGTGLYMWSGAAWAPVTSSSSTPAWSLTGNTGTSYASNFIGTIDNVGFRVRTNNIQRILVDSLGDVAIGSTAFNPNNRERLLVDYGTTTSHTVANFRGSINGYLQINVQNINSGVNASSDFVATADDGTDSTFYVDMGINSSNYAPSVENWGNVHDAYLYSNSRNLLIGTQADPSDVIFLLGGGRIKENAAMRITGPSGNVVIGKGESTDNPLGNIIRGPNGNGTNIAGGSLTLQGGNATGTGTGGSLNLYGGRNTSGVSSAVNIRANPLTITGIQTTTTFSTDSVLTIKAGVVKKAPYSSLPGGGGGAWTTSGNAGTNTVTNFIGTTDSVGLSIRTNNIQRLLVGPQDVKAKLGTGGKFLIVNNGTPPNEFVKLLIRETGEVNWYLDGQSMFIRQTNFEYDPGKFGTYDFFHVDGTNGRLGFNVLSNTVGGLDDNLPLTSSVNLFGSIATRVRGLNGSNNYAIKQDDHIMIIDKQDLGTNDMILPSVTVSKGRELYFKRNGFNRGVIEVIPQPGEQLNGVVDSHVDLKLGNACMMVVCDGISWWVITEVSARGQTIVTSFSTSVTTEDAVEVNFTAANQSIDVDLPSVADYDGKRYEIKRNANGAVFSGNVLRIVPASGENLDQSTFASPYIMENDFESVTVQSNGTKWLIMNNYNAENAVVAVTTPYIPNKNDKTILADASLVGFTVTLPGAATVEKGKTYTIKRTNAGANTVIVDGKGSETMDGIASLRLNQRFDYLQLQSDGTNWMIISERISPSLVINPALPYAATAYDGTISSNSNGTINLPGTAAVLGGKIFTIKNSATAGNPTLTVAPNGSETIDGSTTWPLFKGQFVTIQSDGTNWIVIGQ